MTAAKKLDLISVDDYLAGELVSPVKHEYLGGIVYAMAGAINSHNAIASNTLVALGSRLRGQICRPYNSDTKIRVRLPTHTRFYYPDVSVVCRPNPPSDSFQDDPAVLVEVISESTRRIDEGEKRDAYLTIGSLCAFVLIEQDSPAALVYRRQEQGFVRETYQGLDAIIPLDEVGVRLPLQEVYEAITFTPNSQAIEERFRRAFLTASLKGNNANSTAAASTFQCPLSPAAVGRQWPGDRQPDYRDRRLMRPRARRDCRHHYRHHRPGENPRSQCPRPPEWPSGELPWAALAWFSPNPRLADTHADAQSQSCSRGGSAKSRAAAKRQGDRQ